MSEKPPTPESSEQLSEKERYELEQEKLFLSDYPSIVNEQLSSESCLEKVTELETLLKNFEETHSLAELQEVQFYTVAEAYAHTSRQAAKKDLPAIVSRMKFLRDQKRVSAEAFRELATTYNLIQAAVGTLRDDGLDHSIRKGF